MTVTRDTVRQVHRLRRQVGGQADRVVAGLRKAWVREWSDLRRRWDRAAAAVVGEALQGWPPPWQLARIPELRRAFDATDVALSDLQHRTEKAAIESASAAVASTLAAEAGIVASQWPAAERDAVAAYTAQQLPPRTGELAAALVTTAAVAATTSLAADTFGTVERLIVRGLPFDRPDTTASRLVALVQHGFNSGLRRAATAVRTETMDAQRQASHAFRLANLPTVTGWVWMSALSVSSCAACWAMHGTVFAGAAEVGPLGHVNCRCVALSLRFGDDLGALPDARARFNQLPEADQVRILGPGRLALLRTGRIGWGDIPARRNNPGWRPSYTTRSLADLQRLARNS